MLCFVAVVVLGEGGRVGRGVSGGLPVLPLILWNSLFLNGENVYVGKPTRHVNPEDMLSVCLCSRC